VLEKVFGDIDSEVVRSVAPPQISMPIHFYHASVYHRGVSLHCVEGAADEGLTAASSRCRCGGGEGRIGSRPTLNRLRR
jgi:hypothetical protein